MIVFLPFAGLLAKLVTKIAPEKETKEVGHLAYLDVRMLDTPALGIVQSYGQINFMADSTDMMMRNLGRVLESDKPKEELEHKIFHREEILDHVQKEIFLFLSHMVSGQVPLEITAKANMQMRMADEYESLSDYMVSVLKGIKKLEKNSMSISGNCRGDLMSLHNQVAAYISKVNQYVKDESADVMTWANTEGVAISKRMKELREAHIARLQNEEASPLFSLVYTDILNYYRRMKDHALNIAEVVSGEK